MEDYARNAAIIADLVANRVAGIDRLGIGLIYALLQIGSMGVREWIAKVLDGFSKELY